MMTRPARLTAAFTLMLASGCDGCGKSEKPYTPFGVASALPSSTAAAEGGANDAAHDAEADAGRPRFEPRSALPAPPSANRWSLDGREISAPLGRVFALGLVTDLDADQKNEIVTWTVPASAKADRTAPGELWLHPIGAAPRKVVSLPGFVPTGPACKHSPTLTQTGPRSVTLDVTAQCTAMLLPRAPVRAVLVVAPLAERPGLVTLRVANAAPGDPFALSVESTDRDADGRDDVHVVLRQLPACRSGAPDASCNPDPNEREARADLVWLDRAAGVSRDASEPSASLARLAAWELGRSKRKKLAAGAIGMVRNVRRLISTLCAEAAVPRVLEEDGTAIRCAPLAVTLERLLTAEVQAALTLGDVQAAVGALDRDGWYVSPVSQKRRDALEKEVVSATKPVTITDLGSVSARVSPHAGRPRWSPLSFAPDGTLWVQAEGRLSRFATADGSPLEVDEEAGTVRWPLDVTSPGGLRLGAVVPSCDRSDVLLQVLDASGNAVTQPRLPLLAPRPGACSGARVPRIGVAPVGFKGESPELVIAGQRVGPLTTSLAAADRTWGSPRSPDGKWLVVPSSLGLLVMTVGKVELWRGSAIGDARRFSDCVVADGATAVACVEGGGVKIAVRP